MATTKSITIHNVTLDQITYKDIPVVTASMIAEVHAIEENTVLKSFRRNKARYIEGKHYHRIDSPETPEGLRVLSPGGKLLLFTEKGYLLLTKPMRDDRSWEVQEQMIDEYFVLKTSSTVNEALDAYPELRAGILALQSAAEAKLTADRAEKAAQEARQAAQGAADATAMVIQGQAWMSIRQYVHANKLWHQLPESLQGAFGRYIRGYCAEKNFPVYSLPPADRPWKSENTYPVDILQALLPQWLARQNGQILLPDPSPDDIV
jgi:hypothetical protein